MAKITDFRCVDDSGKAILADAFGNNVAFGCPECGHPVLAIALDNQRGSDRDHPALCRNCSFRGWIEIKDTERVLRVHKV